MEGVENGTGDAPGSDELTCCKITATAAEYDVSEAVSELVTRRRQGASLRELATFFNTRVTTRALERADVQHGQSIHATLIGEDLAPTVYRMLQGEDGSDVKRAELRARLRDKGVNVDDLETAFVSHVTIRSHLQECVNVQPAETTTDFEKTVNTVRWARTRAENIIQNTLNSAVSTDDLQTGDIETELIVRATCEKCGDTFYIEELFDERQCSCAGRE